MKTPTETLYPREMSGYKQPTKEIHKKVKKYIDTNYGLPAFRELMAFCILLALALGVMFIIITYDELSAEIIPSYVLPFAGVAAFGCLLLSLYNLYLSLCNNAIVNKVKYKKYRYLDGMVVDGYGSLDEHSKSVYKVTVSNVSGQVASEWLDIDKERYMKFMSGVDTYVKLINIKNGKNDVNFLI